MSYIVRGARDAAASGAPSREEGRVFRDAEPRQGGAWPGSLLALVGFIGLSLLVGAADAALMGGSARGWYAALARPPGTPPNWVFAPVWTVLYVMMGTAAWLVWRRIAWAASLRRPLRLWGWQLLLNALWTPAFFGLRNLALALAVIVVLLALLLATTRAFARVDRSAALLMLPYMAWVCYAVYLTAGFWWLNAG